MDQNFSNANPTNPMPTGLNQDSQVKEKVSGGIYGFLLNLGIIIVLLSIYPSFLSFVFDMLNSVFPDSLDGRYYYLSSVSWQDSSIRWAMAMLVVGVPVYILLSWLANRLAYTVAISSVPPGKGKNAGRKIFGSLIIFLSSVVVISDLVALVYYFFGGEVTIRFALKSLITLLSAGGIFWYYLYDIRRDLTVPSSAGRTGAMVVIAITIASIVFGFWVIGSPTQARYKKFDETRVSNLKSISSALGNFWSSKGSLPENLDEMTYFIGKIPVDPETGASYRYSKVDERRFSVCAVFDTEIDSIDSAAYDYYSYYNAPGISDWSHGTGEKCFEGYLDPSVYKIPADGAVISAPKI